MQIVPGTKLADLEFKVSLYRNGEVITWNIFDHSKVKWAVAKYITMTEEERKSRVGNVLMWCFGDYWSRAEYEMVLAPWPFSDTDELAQGAIKRDIYDLYIKPNERLLMKMINSVNKKDAQKYLVAYNKQRKALQAEAKETLENLTHE